MNNTSSDPETGRIRPLISVMEEFRKLDADIQAQTIIILLQIASKPHLQMRELEEATGLASSSVSRNVAALGRVHRKGRPGLGLVLAYEDQEDRRFKRVHLTSMGKKFIETISGILGE